MTKLPKEFFITTLIILSLICFLHTPIVEAKELDLTAAQDAVGKRFASKFCEVKENDFSSESASEFALNNTYLKFVAFPDDEKFIEDLWEFTIQRIRKECGDYVTQNDEISLRDFFLEEGEIASNRDLYLPDS
tara:strand:- start:205 stop:603 length:399 start_codon:yes stop_codon:yes gene_type:complete